MTTRFLIASLVLVASSACTQQTAKAPAQQATAPAAAAPDSNTPPAAPLPAGAKIAYVNVAYIVANSTEGKADNAKVEALVKQKQAEAATQKTQQDAQRFQQEAQADVQKLQVELQQDFQQKLLPVLQQLGKDMHLSVLLSSQDSGVIWGEPGLDLTAEAIKRFDAAMTKK